MSFAISIIGCILGCRISNAPNYEYQAQHHFCIGEPEKERCANRRERTYPYACHLCQPTLEKPLNFDPFGHARFAHLFVLYD